MNENMKCHLQHQEDFENPMKQMFGRSTKARLQHPASSRCRFICRNVRTAVTKPDIKPELGLYFCRKSLHFRISGGEFISRYDQRKENRRS